MRPWAKRMDAIAFSASVNLAQRVRDDKAAGQELYDFTVGEPHWSPPESVLAAVHAGLEHGHTRYSDSRGLLPLRAELARILSVRGVPAAEEFVLLSPGGKQAIYTACHALLDPGDEVILFPPCWVSYADIIKLAGGVPIEVPCHAADRFRPSEEALRCAITPRTKLVIVNNPGNPTGAVWEPAVVSMVARVAAEHDLWLLDDLVYEAFNYSGAPVLPIGATPEGRERTLTVGSFSKSYAMTGFRVGYLSTPEFLFSPCLKVVQQTVTCLPVFVQEGALAALRAAPSFPAHMADHYARLARVVSDELGEIEAGPLEGAFYAFVDVRRKGMTSTAFCDWLYQAYRVACVPGSAFGEAGEGWVRVSYACEESQLREGMRRLAAAIRT